MKAFTFFGSVFFVLIFVVFPEKDVRLIFSEERSLRTSFCLYSDGRFYEARPSGCIGQDFFWGYWEKQKDTFALAYQAENIFDFQIIKSHDSLSKLQFVKVIDCYNQPVRFQIMCYDTVCNNLYNPGILIVPKGKVISYISPLFDGHVKDDNYAFSNADTITFKWYCNRESIESIDGGQLYINKNPSISRIVLGDKYIKWSDRD